MIVIGTVEEYDEKTETAKVAFQFMSGAYSLYIPVSKPQVHAGNITVNSRCVIEILDEKNPRKAVLAYIY